MSRRMKVGLGVVVAVAVLTGVTAIAVLGQQPPAPGGAGGVAPMPAPGPMPGSPQMGPGMGMMGAMGMCPICGAMMGSMMQRSSMAVAGDGVYVMMGNKLMKYDRDLALVKETEIKVDMAKMHEKMQKMMESCPMRQRMMQGRGMMQGGGMMGGDKPAGEPGY